ncbi:tetratricopeptide repeat protein [Sphingomonas sp. LT1P40]|uniref:tetratricopeptide repeat protein n=1 Tax=Alteristakelama amylovorans TaxID=3096166 RepID=UPI002FCBAAF7
MIGKACRVAVLRCSGAILIAAAAGFALPAAAQEAARVPVPPEGIAAFDRGDYGKAADAIIPAFENCRTQQPQGTVCADLAMASAMLVATAGNIKVEDVILRAQDYIDTRVGRESQEALGMLGGLTSYYDRLVAMDKFVPVAERRLALARKLQGPTGRTAVIAAVSLCIAQWNLGKGQAAVELLSPLAGKLPEKTSDEMMLAGMVHECTGTAYYSMDRDREAEQSFRQAVALFERAEGEKGVRSLDAMAGLANALRRQGRDADARAMAVRIDRLAKPDAQVRSRIAWWATGPAANPIEAARAELAKAEKQFGAQSAMADVAAAGLGIALIDAGQTGEAEPYLARLAAATRNEANPASVRIKLLTGQILAIAKQDGGRFDRALPVIEQLVAIAKRTDAGSDKLLINFQMYAGAMLTASGRPGRAYPYLTDAGRLLLARLASYRDFDAAAQSETREYSPIFRFKVATAWRLAQAR